MPPIDVAQRLVPQHNRLPDASSEPDRKNQSFIQRERPLLPRLNIDETCHGPGHELYTCIPARLLSLTLLQLLVQLDCCEPTCAMLQRSRCLLQSEAGHPGGNAAERI